MKAKYLIVSVFICLFLTYMYIFSWRKNTMNELQNSASIELEIAYGRKLSKQFIGPLIESETKKSIEFRFFKVDECDTTFAFIEVSKRGVGGSTVSSITKGCNDSIN